MTIRPFQLSLLLALSTIAPAALAGGGNPIDGHYRGAGKKQVLAFAPADDLTFLRRVTLDLIGKLPTPQQIDAFLADDSLDKRRVYIDELLASEAYTDRWSYYFGELFWNQLLITGDIRNGFHDKIRALVAEDRPWTEMAEFVLGYTGATSGESSPMVFWLLEAFDNDYRLDYLDDQIGYITSTFLGVQTDCISCHDGANHLEQVNKGLSVMKRKQFWGMSAFLAKSYFYYPNRDNTGFDSLELVDLDDPGFNESSLPLYVLTEDQETFSLTRPGGEYMAESAAGEGMRVPRKGGMIEPRYLFTGEQPREGEPRRKALTRMILADRQFARNMVNRMWSHFFGEGFVEPVTGWDMGRIDPETAAQFDIEAQPRDYHLMEALTDAFITSGYNLRALMRDVCNSTLYQADLTAGAAPKGASYWLNAQRTRRMASEAIVDSVYQILETQKPYGVTGMMDRTILSAWALPGTIEPSSQALNGLFGTQRLARLRQMGYASEGDFRQYQEEASLLLNSFGRSQRFDQLPRNDEASIQVALTMMNEDAIHKRLIGDERSPFVNSQAALLAANVHTPESLARALFLRVLVREPTPLELSTAAAHLEANANADGVADLVWALFNHHDFLYK